MTDTTAAFGDFNYSGSRIFSPGECRRVIRFLAVGAGFGLGSLAAVCALVVTVTVAAAWIVGAAVGGNPNLHARTPSGPMAIALASRYPTVAGAADITGSIRVSAGPADAQSFEARWAGAIAPASTRTHTVALVPQHPVERASEVASLRPHRLPPAPSRVGSEIAGAPGSMQFAELTPAATPASAPPASLKRPPEIAPERAVGVPLPKPHPAPRAIALSAAGEAVTQVAPGAAPPASSLAMRVAPQPAPDTSTPLPGRDSRTAVYDIAAHTVYLPNGDKLEAHSGLGNKLDDPRYVRVKNRGPTPPNVYDLALREQPFHGVRAIRLNPVDEGKMFGRDGMLAHSYMLGSNGQSNGCVSFKEYPKFLHAVLRGEVNRLVVVQSLGGKPALTTIARRGPGRRYAGNNS